MGERVGILALGGLSLPLLALAALAVPSADDFSHANLIRDAGGVLPYATAIYAAWSGRFLVELLTGAFLGSVDAVPLVVALSVLAFVGLALGLAAGMGARRVALADAWAIRPAVAARTAALASGATLVPSIRAADPQDIRSAPDYWVNVSVARYYGLASVRLSP